MTDNYRAAYDAIHGLTNSLIDCETVQDYDTILCKLRILRIECDKAITHTESMKQEHVEGANND